MDFGVWLSLQQVSVSPFVVSLAWVPILIAAFYLVWVFLHRRTRRSPEKLEVEFVWTLVPIALFLFVIWLGSLNHFSTSAPRARLETPSPEEGR